MARTHSGQKPLQLEIAELLLLLAIASVIFTGVSIIPLTIYVSKGDKIPVTHVERKTIRGLVKNPLIGLAFAIYWVILWNFIRWYSHGIPTSVRLSLSYIDILVLVFLPLLGYLITNPVRFALCEEGIITTHVRGLAHMNYWSELVLLEADQQRKLINVHVPRLRRRFKLEFSSTEGFEKGKDLFLRHQNAMRTYA